MNEYFHNELEATEQKKKRKKKKKKGKKRKKSNLLCLSVKQLISLFTFGSQETPLLPSLI
jgi:hypothetical protein